jgi:hypothetical protein
MGDTEKLSAEADPARAIPIIIKVVAIVLRVRSDIVVAPIQVMVKRLICIG